MNNFERRMRKLEGSGGAGFEPCRREIVDGTEKENAERLAQIGSGPGNWIARVIVPPQA